MYLYRLSNINKIFYIQLLFQVLISDLSNTGMYTIMKLGVVCPQPPISCKVNNYIVRSYRDVILRTLDTHDSI